MKKARSLTGDLRDISVPEIFRTIYLEKMTGMLALRRETAKKFFFFQDGSTIYAVSSLPEEQLGRFLVEGRRISETQYTVLLNYVKRKGWSGDGIYQTGILERNDLEWWTKVMVRDLVLSVFRWIDGFWRFFPDRSPGERVFRVQLETMKLIMGTVRRLEDLTLLRSWIGSFDDVPRIRPAVEDGHQLQDLNLTSHEGFILSRIDGRTSLRQIVSISGPNKMDTVKFLFGALVSGIIEIDRPGEQPSSQRFHESSVSADRFDDPLDLTWEDLSAIELSPDELHELDISGDDFFDKQAVKQGEITDVQLLDDEGNVIEADGGVLDLATLQARQEQMKTGAATDEEKAEDEAIVYIIAGEEVDAETGDLLGDSARRRRRFTGRKDLEGKSINDLWEDWIQLDADGTSVAQQEEEQRRSEIEARWSDWMEIEDRERDLDEQIARIQDELRSVPSGKDPVLQRKLEEVRELRAALEESKKREIVYVHSRMQTRTHYEALAIRTDANDEAIRDAFFHWSSEFNPERTLSKGLGSVRQLLEELYDRVRTAYGVLSQPEERARYDESLFQAHNAEFDKEERKRQIAERNYQDALATLTRGDARRATDYLRAAISLNPYRAEFFDKLAEILEMDPKWRWESLRHLNRAIQLAPRMPLYYVRVGKLFQEMSRPRLARKAFAMALRFEPTNSAAKRGLQETK